MGNKYRQPPSDLVRSQLDIQDRVTTLETSPRAVATSVDSGNWKFIADNGVELANFGDQGPGLGRGWIFRRGDTGIPAFYLGGNQGSGRQFWRLCDNNLNDVITDDASSGQGLARPYIPYTPVKNSDVGAPAQTTTSTSFVGAYVIAGLKQHPVVYVQYIVTTPVGVSIEVRLLDTSSSINEQIALNSHPGSSFFFTWIQAPLKGEHLSEMSLELQMRVSGGAGTVGITCVYAYGRQS